MTRTPEPCAGIGARRSDGPRRRAGIPASGQLALDRRRPREFVALNGPIERLTTHSEPQAEERDWLDADSGELPLSRVIRAYAGAQAQPAAGYRVPAA